MLQRCKQSSQLPRGYSVLVVSFTIPFKLRN